MNSSNNKLHQSFWMVLIASVILIFLSFNDSQFSIGSYTSKKVNLFSDIISIGKIKNIPLPEVIVNDSIIAKDSLAYEFRKVDPANILDFEKGDSSSLTNFFEALNKLKAKKGKVRIAYFGDSMIEGDLISQDFRSFMQDYFGGNGVGFVPITSIVSGFRTSIRHQFGSWKTYNLIESVPANHHLGISGYCFVPSLSSSVDTNSNSSASWVKYWPSNKKHLNKFYQVKLLYGKSEGSNYVKINGASYKLSGGNYVNQLEINSKNGLSAVDAQFICNTPIDIYGFSMESDSGVFVDNFSFRGNSGQPLIKIPRSVYEATDKCLGYDLIILEYGLNAVSPKVTDFSWYERGMLETIKHIKTSFPNSSILIISVGDKAYRNNGVYETDPSVPLLVTVQKYLAQKTGSAYWSLYDAMGGSGSMVKWVEGDTVYANRDYTHFNFKGAHRVGKLLFTKLMGEYSDYNKKKNLLK